MAIPCSLKDLDLKKFVECPDGSGQVAQSVKVCNPKDIVSGGAKTQTIYNEVIAAANTEQSLVLPTSVTSYLIKTRGSGILKLTHVSGESGTKYLTIPPRAVYTDSNSLENITLYFQSPTAGEIVEVVTWE